MKNIVILLLISISSFGQRPDTKTLVLYGDTLWVKNVTTGDSTQINKVAASVTSQSIIAALGYTPSSPTDLGLKANLISPLLVTPNIGAATGISLTVTGTIGYGATSGGTVTQLTSKATAVTLNKISGQITMNAAALAAGAEAVFTVNNSLVSATDVPVIAIQSAGTAGSYLGTVSSVSAGAFTVTISNASAGSLSQALVLNFIIIKGSNN